MRATAFRNFKRGIAILAIVCMMFALMPANTFAFQATDISGHWAQVKIQSWIDKGLIKGYPDGTFKPDQDITRAEFMALVNRAFGYTAVVPITYTDVKAGSWYAPEVAKAQAAGYISGYPDGTMKPENPITREEVATIVARIKNLTSDVNAAGKYTDAAKIGSWSKGQVGAVTSAKIMQGYPDGSFKPQGLITRAEVVEALDNALHYTAPVVVTPPVVTPPVVTPPVVTPPVVTYPGSTYPVTTYPVTFTVADATYAKIDGASITIASQTIATDVYGVATINLGNGTYPYGVTAAGYDATSGSAVVNGAAVAVPVTMTATAAPTAAPTYAVTFTVAGGVYAIDGASFTVADGVYAIDGASVAIVNQDTIATDVYGRAIFYLADGTYAYDVTKTGYNAPSGSAEVNGAALLVPVTMTADVTSAVFATTNLNNTVTVTLTGGTFKAAPIVAADFAFAGTDAGPIAAGTFTRTSDTVVTITGLEYNVLVNMTASTLAGGADNTVLVKAATQATQATSVAAVASTP